MRWSKSCAVYFYESVPLEGFPHDGPWWCCCCCIVNRADDGFAESWYTDSLEAVMAHLQEHEAAGHPMSRTPAEVVARILVDQEWRRGRRCAST